MNLRKQLSRLLLGLMFTSSLILVSCQGFNDYIKQQFPEIDTTTYVRIDGQLMAPVANTTIYIKDLLPKTKDSTSFWLEVDNNKLIHAKMRIDSLFSLQASTLGITATWPANIPFGPAPLPPIVFEQDLPSTGALPQGIQIGGISMKIFLSSTLTATIQAQVDSIKFFNTQTGESALYKVNIPFTIHAASGANPALDTIVIDSTTFPELAQAMAISPDKARFVLSGNIPKQTLTGDLQPSQSVNANLFVDIPLYIYSKNLMIVDTTEMNLPLNDSIFKDILVKAVAENDIPLGGKVYFAFVDSTITDTIAIPTNPDFVNSTDTLNVLIGTKSVTLRPVVDLKAAETDLAGNPITPILSVSKLDLSYTNIENLQNYNGKQYLLIFAKLNTYNSDRGQFVKILSSCYLHLKLGAKVQYSTSF